MKSIVIVFLCVAAVVIAIEYFVPEPPKRIFQLLLVLTFAAWAAGAI